MTPEEIPVEYRNMLNAAVGKNYSLHDPEMIALARILTDFGDDEPPVKNTDVDETALLMWPAESTWSVVMWSNDVREWLPYEGDCTTEYDALRLLQTTRKAHPGVLFRLVMFTTTHTLLPTDSIE